MLKLALFPVVSAIVMFSACPVSKAPAPSSTGRRFPTGSGMDSPIVVSDDSHLRHKGAADDFVISYASGEQVNTFSDSGKAPKTIKCDGMTVYTAPSSPSDDCTTGAAPSGSGWEIDLFDQANAGGHNILTLTPYPASATSTRCDPNVACGVTANFEGRYIDPEKDNSQDTVGTDITEHETDGSKSSFVSARFTNGSDAMVLNCTNPNPPSDKPHDCKIKIAYK